jgi:hypothetical protein
MQPGVAVGQTTPQSWQFFGSDERSVQVPPQSVMPVAAQESGA